MPGPTTSLSTTTQPHGPDDGGASLVHRARSLRAQSSRVGPVLGVTYRRRAAELSLAAWLHALRSAPVEVDEFAELVA
jgi:hypothetical protein